MNKSNFKNVKVLVIGLGISGQSAADFLLKRGAFVTGTDSRKDLILIDENLKILSCRGLIIETEEKARDVCRFSLVVVSPGIPKTHPCYLQALKEGLEIIGEIELACREMTQKCLAITGTNGKTTVTLLTEHVLKSVGIKALALGNVGIPLTKGLDHSIEVGIDVFVIELSSFQLETLNCVFIDCGVILNITPDHLDRYDSMGDYAYAKIKMKNNIKKNGQLFIEEKCFNTYHSQFNNDNIKTYGYTPKCTWYTDTYHVNNQKEKSFSLPPDYRGKPSHDIENIMASYILCESVGITPEQFILALSSFKKPPHRIEFVREVNGVCYIDDSKGTNIDAVIRSVKSIETPIILICGGVDKGFPYTSWIEPFKPNVRLICAIGQSKKKIKNELLDSFIVELFETFEEAVIYAAKSANQGDTVLLSPGCSSFDMFKSYAHRGNEFQRIVNALYTQLDSKIVIIH